MDLEGKIAIVTGGASGIGRAVSMGLAKESVRAIAIVDLSKDTAPFCEQLNKDLGRDVLVPFQGDVTDGDFRDRVFQSMEDQFGVVSLCVPAAGIVRDRLCVKLDQTNGTVKPDIYSEEDFRRILDVDLVAPVYWAMRTIASVAMDRSKAGLKKWDQAESMQGAIVLIGSVSSAGNKGQVSYAAAKSGLDGAQATLAMEAIYHGVRCAIIHPGFTDTPMVHAMGEDVVRNQVLPNTQLGRLIRPDEIGSAIVFLLKNSAVSGCLWVDAGWHPTT